MSCNYVSKKLRFTDNFVSLGYLSINFGTFISKMIANLLTPNFVTIFVNVFFPMNLLKALSCWYAMRIIFVFAEMISSYSLIIAAASSNFSTLFGYSSKFTESIFFTINQWAYQLFSLINCAYLCLTFSSWQHYQIPEATLLKSHFGMVVLQYIYCIFSEHLF